MWRWNRGGQRDRITNYREKPGTAEWPRKRHLCQFLKPVDPFSGYFLAKKEPKLPKTLLEVDPPVPRATVPRATVPHVQFSSL